MAIPATALAPSDYLAAIRRDSDRMISLAGGELDAPIETCPGWTVRDALVHTGEVYSHKVASLKLPPGPERPSEWDHGPADGEDVAAWFTRRRDELVGELEARGPDQPCHTWHRDFGTAWFWFRRMAQETVVHRVDVETGRRDVTGVDEALAVDGIDEVLDWFLVHDHDEVGPNPPGRGSVVVRAGGQVWRVRLEPDGAALERGGDSGDATVSGPAGELLLWLWGRRPDDAVTIEGDAELVAALRARLVAVTQ